jgi:anti-sigma regulatory factor (Ser/Thr protein kinase)
MDETDADAGSLWVTGVAGRQGRIDVITQQRNGGRDDHLVYFYAADGELADRAGSYLREALDAGGVAIAIASEPHLAAIGDKLATIGADPEDAIGDGRLILLDGRATLDKLIVNGQVNREAFNREVGSVVRAAFQRHSVIRAYGEMVDLLWQDGDIPGAIALERVWNELMVEVPFKLLCAYCSTAVSAPEHGGALRTICELHTTHETSRDFQPDVTAPGVARRFIEQALRGWGHHGSVIDDARLLISELVTNAVTHTRSPFSVSVASHSAKLRLAVHDTSSALPVRGDEPGPSGGRGLHIVAAVANDWGVVTSPPGKTVWAELSATPT